MQRCDGIQAVSAEFAPAVVIEADVTHASMGMGVDKAQYFSVHDLMDKLKADDATTIHQTQAALTIA